MSRHYKVSLILTTYNCKYQLERTMASIAMQDYDNIEVVIKDGKSTDGTLNLVTQYADDFKYPIIWKSESDTGIYDALNQGIEMSTGDIVGICNDLLTVPDAISQMVHAIETEGTDGVHADLIYATDTEVVRYWHMGQGTIARGWMPGHPTLYLKRSVYDKYGLYDTSYKVSADFEFMVRILADEKVRLSYIPKVLVRMFYGGTSTSSADAYWTSISESHTALVRNHVRHAWWLILERTFIVMKQFRVAKRMKLDEVIGK